jgi:small-conductance mechanosensitive channel
MTGEYLAYEVLGNPVHAWATAVAVFMAVILVARIAVLVVMNNLKQLAAKTSGRWDDFLIELLQRRIGFWVYFFTGLYLASRSLVLPDSIHIAIRALFVGWLCFKAVWILQELLGLLVSYRLTRDSQQNPAAAAMVKNIQMLLQAVLWVVALLFVLNNLGVNISAAVAGLGIGGVAVALAAQVILGDAFSSFAIYLDKPFEVGDFVIVGDMMGTVEYIGFKTTRIRSLGGEQLVFANSDLTSSRIRNYKRMNERRVVFEFGVVYQTTSEQMRLILDAIKEIVKGIELTRLDRVHFKRFGDFALTFEVVYFVLSADYNLYMDIQQKINLGLMDAFAKHGIQFAYPTQQLYVTQVEGKN